MGLHSGERASVRLLPAPEGTGLVFVVDGTEVLADLGHAVPVPGATTLQAHGVVVSTPEHLLSACRGMGVADLLIELEGGELPALDGGARVWMEELAGGELLHQGSWEPLRVEPGRVACHGGEVELVALSGGEVATVSVEVDFPDGPFGSATWDGTVEGYRETAAWARTFVLEDQVEELRAAGRGRGADRHNTAVVPRRRVSAAEDPLAREAVAHKLLDAIGDLALAPPLAAHVLVRRGSHQVHVEGLRELLGQR